MPGRLSTIDNYVGGINLNHKFTIKQSWTLNSATLRTLICIFGINPCPVETLLE